MSLQVTPSPVKPLQHAQVNEPGVSVQSAYWLQLSLPRSHSLKFVHETPSPK